MLTQKEEPGTNWVRSRVDRTTDALTRAFEHGLTGHVFVKRNGKTVVLADGTEAVEFTSCSYLGLETHSEIIAAAERTLRRTGVHFASARTRMRPAELDELESILGEIYRGNSVTCFTSVSNVHLSVLPLLGSGTLPSYPVSGAGVTFFVERTAHASIQVLRGILQQIGEVDRFSVDEIEVFVDRLERARSAGRTPIILVDGVGSMGGLIDIKVLLDLAEVHGGYLYVDDAHGISITGPQGGGYAFEEFGRTLPRQVILAGSLSKAFGCAGGFGALADEADSRVVRRFGNPLIFGGPIALPMVGACLASARLHVRGGLAGLQDRLWRNVSRFDARTGGALVNAGLRSPIRGALFATEEEALETAARLRRAGILVTPAFYPTVARGTGLIRFALSALHTEEHIDAAARDLRPTA